MAEGCHVEVRLVVRGLTGADSRRRLACVTHNQAGGQEVQALIRLDGGFGHGAPLTQIVINDSRIYM